IRGIRIIQPKASLVQVPLPLHEAAVELVETDAGLREQADPCAQGPRRLRCVRLRRHLRVQRDVQQAALAAPRCAVQGCHHLGGEALERRRGAVAWVGRRPVFAEQHLQESDEFVCVGRADLVHPVYEDCNVPRVEKRSLEAPLRGLNRTRRSRDARRRSQQLH
ncbi:Protein of unknown function, partial [Gryllus bimaculatus]